LRCRRCRSRRRCLQRCSCSATATAAYFFVTRVSLPSFAFPSPFGSSFFLLFFLDENKYKTNSRGNFEIRRSRTKGNSKRTLAFEFEFEFDDRMQFFRFLFCCSYFSAYQNMASKHNKFQVESTHKNQDVYILCILNLVF